MSNIKRKLFLHMRGEVRELAGHFGKHNKPVERKLIKLAGAIDREDRKEAVAIFKDFGTIVQGAILDLAPASYDWIRFGVSWLDSEGCTISVDDEKAAKKFLKANGGNLQAAYNAALQKYIRTEDEKYATFAAYYRRGGHVR